MRVLLSILTVAAALAAVAGCGDGEPDQPVAGAEECSGLTLDQAKRVLDTPKLSSVEKNDAGCMVTFGSSDETSTDGRARNLSLAAPALPATDGALPRDFRALRDEGDDAADGNVLKRLDVGTDGFISTNARGEHALLGWTDGKRHFMLQYSVLGLEPPGSPAPVPADELIAIAREIQG